MSTPKIKYFLDTEFIENGSTIDLLSIALVCEDSRTFYRQHKDAKFKEAGDWVWRNVFPHLQHFNMSGRRNCQQLSIGSMGDLRSWCHNEIDCPWRSRLEIRDEVLAFCDPEKFGKPSFWGYYADYDWVAFCQLFGSMVSIPKGFPMYCNDLKQWCNSLGDPELPKQGKDEHSSLLDAQWNKKVWEFLSALDSPK